MSDWIETSVAEISSHARNAAQIGPFGSKVKAENYTSEGVPYLRGVNVNTDARFHDDEFVFLDAEFSSDLTQFFCKPNDIIFVHRGTIGKFGLIPTNARFPFYVLGNSMLKLTCDPSKADSAFVYYWFCSPDGQEFIFSRVAQTGVPAIASPLRTLRECKIPLPPLDEQRAIARVLGSLDYKIELNRRMNRTLEELAAALFRSWFVDFDPVVAKAAGRKPAHLRPALAALFPAHWQDSTLGPIPHGWRVGTVDEIMDVTMGQSPPGTSYNEIGEGVPFFQGCTDFGFRFPTNRVFCTAPTRHAEKGDILLSVRAPVGDTNIALEDCAIGRGLAALRGRNGERSFPLYALRSQADEFASYEGEGTLFGAINGPALRGLRLILPPAPVMEAFEKCAVPWDATIEHNERESRTLAALRDTLLPKLLSGELRVKSAGKLVEAKA